MAAGAVTVNGPAISFGISTTGIKALQKALKAAADGTAKQLTTGMKAAGSIVQNQAKQNASWSSKIPGKIKVSVAGGGISIYITDGEAISYETDGKHPVFDSRHPAKRWNKTPLIRPFLIPAAESTSDAVASAILDAVADFNIPEVME